MQKVYRKKDDSRRVFIPGLGLVRPGVLYVGDFSAYGEFLEEVSQESVGLPTITEDFVRASIATVDSPIPDEISLRGVADDETVIAAVERETFEKLNAEVGLEATFPIKGYDEMGVKAVLAALDALEYVDDLQIVLAYEQAHKNRKTVTRALGEMLKDA